MCGCPFVTSEPRSLISASAWVYLKRQNKMTHKICNVLTSKRRGQSLRQSNFRLTIILLVCLRSEVLSNLRCNHGRESLRASRRKNTFSSFGYLYFDEDKYSWSKLCFWVQRFRFVGSTCGSAELYLFRVWARSSRFLSATPNVIFNLEFTKNLMSNNRYSGWNVIFVQQVHIHQILLGKAYLAQKFILSQICNQIWHS